MELKVKEVSIPKNITFNYEELKQELTDKVSMYESLVYTDENIKEAKADRANLNKLKKALNDERIRREKEYMQPFNDFKSKINEIISIIDKPVQLIDKQIKTYDEKLKADKENEIMEYWKSEVDADHIPNGMTIDAIFDTKWLNASVSMKVVKEAINTAVDKFKTDMETLSNLPEFGFEAQQVYINTLDINKALAEGQRMAKIAKAKAEKERLEKEKAEEEKRVKAEAEAKKQEEFIPPVVDEEFDSKAFSTNNNTEDSVEEAATKEWVSFKCLLSIEDAQALGEFLKNRNIKFEQI